MVYLPLQNMPIFAALAAERFIGTFHPLRYPEIVTMGRVKVVLGLIVFLSTAVYFPLVAFGNRYRDDLPCIFFVIYPPWLMWSVCGVILFFMLLTTITYMAIMRTAIRLQKQVWIGTLVLMQALESCRRTHRIVLKIKINGDIQSWCTPKLHNPYLKIEVVLECMHDMIKTLSIQ